MVKLYSNKKNNMGYYNIININYTSCEIKLISSYIIVYMETKEMDNALYIAPNLKQACRARNYKTYIIYFFNIEYIIKKVA